MTYLVEWSMVEHLKYTYFQLHLQPRKQKKYDFQNATNLYSTTIIFVILFLYW